MAHTRQTREHVLLALKELKILKGKKDRIKGNHDTSYNTKLNWREDVVPCERKAL